MGFSSVSFLFFFLPIFMAAYFATPGIAGKNIVTLLFSLLFYAWGEPRFVLVLLGSIAFNMVAALAIDCARDGWRGGWLAVAVTANLALLGFCKYADFIAANVNQAFGPLVAPPAIPLPLGISFFTFHCLSYVTDVYRRRFPANRDPIQVALYIALFPQLVAGPIVRYGTVARQLHRRRHTLARASAGARIFVIGLAQKVLVADQVARIAEAAFDGAPKPSFADAWAGLLAYTVQIYFDFAGYSNMAIGLGICLGFTLPRNFRLPYTARSVTEFWRRWHMSLSSWLRDYLYIPLGGNRGSRARTYANLATVFVLCGLWHGASWNFVLWGALHGLFLIVERVGFAAILRRLPAPVAWGYTLLCVAFAWVLFRAHDLHGAILYYRSLLGWHGLGRLGFDLHMAMPPGAQVALAAGAALALLPRWLAPLRRALQPLPAPIRIAVATLDGAWLMALLALAVLSVAGGAYSPFLYFRF